MNKEIFSLITTFCTVVEENSFTRAAELLGVNPPAVSKTVAKLESLVGKKLLNRTTRKMEVTEVGKLLYSEGTKHLLGWDELIERTRSYDTLLQGRLKITCTPTVGEALIAQSLSDFKKKYPELSLDLLFTNEIVKLPSQNIDIALRSSRSLEDSSLMSKKVYDVRRVIVASPEYLARLPNRFDSPAQLSEVSCLNFYHRKPFSVWEYALNGDVNQVETHSEVKCNNYETLKKLCVNGLGVARLFEYQIRPELNNGTLIELFPDYHWGQQSIHAIYNERMNNSPKVKAFIEYLCSNTAQ